MKKMRRLFLWVLLAITLLTYSTVWVSPEVFRWSGIISFAIPVLLLVNFVAILVLMFMRSSRALIPAIAIVAGYQFILVSFPLMSQKTEGGGLSLMSYNVKWFSGAKSDEKMDVVKKWLIDFDADIMCFQEFYSRYRLRKTLMAEDYQAVFGNGNRTLAIFSKQPIIDSGVLLDEGNINNILYADILYKTDTIRIYNAHLQSMGIEVESVVNSSELNEGYQEVQSRFVRGSAMRAAQVEVLLQHAKSSPYPLIIVGDFNDVPYSYNHFRLRRAFNNAFEEAGSGLGATFNEKIPFLRIDHQFFSDDWRIHQFETLSSQTLSDHFPIAGIYSLN